MGQVALRDKDLVAAETSAKIFGATEREHERLGLWLNTYIRNERDEILPTLRALFGETEFNTAWQKGRALSMEQATKLAMSETTDGQIG